MLDVELARLQVMGPAAGMIVTGILAAVFWVIMAVFVANDRRYRWFVERFPQESTQFTSDFWTDGCSGVVFGALIIGVSGLIVFGARRLMNLEGPGWVFLAIALCMLPWSPAILIGFPIGIWALFVLNRPAVKMAFAQRALGNSAMPVPLSWNASSVEPQATGPIHRRFRSMLLGIQSLFVGSRATPPSRSPADARETEDHFG